MAARLHDWFRNATQHPAWPLFALFVVILYIPTCIELGRTVWQTDDGSYGPLILLATLFVIWQVHGRLKSATSVSACLAGIVLLALGLLSYVVGRSQGIIQLDAGSPIPVIAGSVLILGGWSSLGAMLFPILYLFFCIPLPGVVVVALTETLKVLASSIFHQSLGWVPDGGNEMPILRAEAAGDEPAGDVS